MTGEFIQSAAMALFSAVSMRTLTHVSWTFKRRRWWWWFFLTIMSVRTQHSAEHSRDVDHQVTIFDTISMFGSWKCFYSPLENRIAEVVLKFPISHSSHWSDFIQWIGRLSWTAKRNGATSDTDGTTSTNCLTQVVIFASTLFIPFFAGVHSWQQDKVQSHQQIRFYLWTLLTITEGRFCSRNEYESGDRGVFRFGA